MTKISEPWVFLAYVFILLGAIFCYWPGLSGPFLLDDFANLDALGSYGGVTDWESFRLFVFGNHSGPTGRPLSMLSFLLNDNAWPSNAWSFKYTNLMLHTLNGVLLFALVYLILLPSYQNKTSPAIIALLSSGIWLLHSLNVSTVLYPVQRMAILAALFVILGLLGYVYGRSLIAIRPRAGHLIMSLSLICGSLLAVICKENGALLPLLAGTLELSILSKYYTNRPNKFWRMAFLWAPAGLLFSYFLYILVSGSLSESYTSREFSLTQRLLTEPRILFDYLYYWFLPYKNSPGLLTQDFKISLGMLSPITTIASFLGIAAILTLTLYLRNRFPLFTLASLFYFTGHLLESSFLPLELYYEHRNYLPGIFLALPLASGTQILLSNKHNRLAIIVSFILLVTPAAATVTRVSYWSDDESLAYHWAQTRPYSQRAQRNAALVAETNGKPQLALSILSDTKKRLPENVSVHLHWLTLYCRTLTLTPELKFDANKVLQNGYFSFRNTDLLKSSIFFLASASCKGGNLGFSLSLLDSLAKNPGSTNKAGPKHQIYHIRGELLLYAKDYKHSIIQFRNSLEQIPRIETALQQVSLLASAGQYKLALAHLDYATKFIDFSHKAGEIDYQKEISILRVTLENDLNPDTR